MICLGCNIKIKPCKFHLSLAFKVSFPVFSTVKAISERPTQLNSTQLSWQLGRVEL